MKAAYIFYFQYNFKKIRIINMYFIIHGSVIIYMCSKSVWLTMRAIQFNWLFDYGVDDYMLETTHSGDDTA